MFPYIRASAILSLSFLSACATITPNDSGKATYYESSFDDKNRAPASFMPAVVSADGGATLDPLYMRTQADYFFAMGEAYSLEGNTPKAIESFRMVLIYDQESPAVHMRLATEYLKQGLITESLAQAEEAAYKDPKNIEAHLLLGGLYSSMKLFPKAMTSYNQVLKLEPQNMEAPLYIGALYSEQKQHDKAVKYFESLAKNPDYANQYLAYYYMGRVRMEQSAPQHQKSAEEYFKTSMKMKPAFVDSVLSLATLYNNQKREAKALALYTDYQRENGANPRIAEILAQHYIEKNDYEKAYTQLEIIEQDAQESLSVRMKMALILIEQKKFKQAAGKLEEVLQEAPDSDKVRFYLAAVYEEMKQSQKAIEEYAQVPASSNFYGEAVVHRAYLLKGMGKMEQALEVAKKGLSDRKDQPQIYAMYASLLDEKDMAKEAAAVLQEGISKFPDNAQLRFYYGTISDRLGNKDVVVAQMKKVLEIDPHHVQGMNYLAYTFAEMNVNLKQAESLARKALEFEPKDGYILDTLGWILYKQSKYAESVKYLEAAHKHLDSVSIIAEHLGDAYHKQSMVEKAKQMYLKAIDLESDTKKAEEIRGKIAAMESQELKNPRIPASTERPVAEVTNSK